MTEIKSATEPKALAYYFGASSKLVEILTQCGVRPLGFSDAKNFLANLDRLNPNVSFIDANPEQIKVVMAAIKAIRKVLGQVIPIVAIIPPENSELKASLEHAGATTVLTSPLSVELIAPILRRYVVTSELAQLQEKEDQAKLGLQPTGPVPAIIDWVFEKVFPVMASVSGVLENLDEIETRTRFYEDKIRPFQTQFVDMVNAMRKGGDENKMPLTQCLRLYGLNNARTLVVADRLLEALRGEGLHWNDKTGRLEDDIKKMVASANLLREHFGEDSLYREVSFNGGLVFDILTYHSEQIKDRKSTLKKEMEASRKRAADRAGRAIKAAKTKQDLKLAKHIVTTALMTEAGRLAMTVFYPDYIDFMKAVEKAKIKTGLLHIAEREKYGISHNLLGAFMCQITPGLSGAYAAVLFRHYPFMLSNKGEGDLHALAEMTNEA